MSLLPENFSFSRMGLPIIALIGVLVAAYFIFRDLPDRELTEPEN